ncbi:MAG: Gfo/Idh/MocA family oxidoreductase [Planctomycetota bacterium]|nr:Gfo/Idh/MocA family oxidoreductase [Planctomycetota bacterium]
MDIGILGLAHPHVQAYVGRWQERPEWGLRVTAAWDRDPTRRDQAAKDYALRACATEEELLDDCGLGGVVIAAETSDHARLAERAAGAGKAIVMQKPLALTLAEADRIVEAVERAGVPFSLAWQMRTDPQNLKMKELLAGGRFGRVLMVRRRHGLGTHTWPGFETSWHVAPEYNRDIWADDASHPADFLYWLLGMPASVTAELGTLVNPKIPHDNGIAIFRYAGGPIAEICCSFTCLAGENTTEIVCEKGTIIQNHGDVPSANVPRWPGSVGLKWFLQEEGRWTAGDTPEVANHGERIAGLAGPLAEFFQGRRPPIATAREGRDVLRMILATYESNATGRRVTL